MAETSTVNRTMRMPETLETFRSQSAYTFSGHTSAMTYPSHAAGVAPRLYYPMRTHREATPPTGIAPRSSQRRVTPPRRGARRPERPSAMRLHFRHRALWPSIPHDPGVTQRADVLVLEDNPTELEEIVTVTEACGLDTLATRSPQQAIRLLRANDPVLAILDWNMRLSPDAERTAENVLRTLARDHPETFTIVFALRAGSDLDLQNQIAVAHPGAIPHDKLQGLTSLLLRVRQLLQRKVGDLRVDRGTVVHVPSGTRYQNKWGVRLLCGYPEATMAKRHSTPYMAMYRFGVWLRDVDSTVSLESEGAGFYHLEVTGTRSGRAAQRR